MNVASKRGESAQRRRDVLERLLEMTTLLGEGMESDAAGRGLTVARAEVVWLVHHRGPMRQRDLADSLRVSPRNVTGLLDALQSTGFVARTPHPSDRRATLIELTELGRAAAEALVADQAEFAGYLFAGVDPAEFDRFLLTADKILDRLRERAYGEIRQAALDRWAAQNPAIGTHRPAGRGDQRPNGKPGEPPQAEAPR